MKNRIDTLFETKRNKILSVYFTAGYPRLNDTVEIMEALQSSGCNMIEIGIPFSDPLADGPVIQHSGNVALANGIHLKKLFEQLRDIRKQIHIPLILMGYMNPVMQYGVEKFCADAAAIGIDGLILPDLPPEVYEKQYQQLFLQHGLHNIMLVTPRTDETRIRYLEKLGGGFIYAIASSATTGSAMNDNSAQVSYFNKLNSMKLKLPLMAGFGIGNRQQFEFVCDHLSGGIIGSTFIKHFGNDTPVSTSIPKFIQSLI
jgi:tryptophan synthase alpha chain